MDNLSQILPFLKQGLWACKIDLKHAYFHLPVTKSLAQYLVIQVGAKFLSVSGSPIWAKCPPIFVDTSNENFQQVMEKKGLLVFIYLDDILVLSNSPKNYTEI